MNLLRRLLGWLRPRLPVLNIGLALGAYGANQYLIQGFCQPVAWAAWVLALSVGAFLAWPWLKQIRGLNYLLLFGMGVLVTVCLYCTLFAGPYLLLALLLGFLVLPLLLWVPVGFGIQAVGRAWASPLPGARWVFGLGALALLLLQGWAWRQYRQVVTAVATLPPGQRHQAGPLLRVVPRTYMAERLAGQLFKYHALPDMIEDGWRPPLHDPLVNVCMAADFLVHLSHPEAARTGPLIIGRWNSDYGGYWESDINAQAAFYHALFPGEPVKVSCTCAHTGDAKTYYAWQPGLTDGVGTSLVEVERNRKETEVFLRAQADSAAANSH